MQAIYRAFDATAAPQKTQCPGGQCPSAQCPNCPNGQCPYLLPYRQKEAERPGPAPGAWPSFGAAAAGPDYSTKLDRLIELQEKAIAAASIPAAAAAPDYGPQIREAADMAKDAGKKADEAKAAIKPAIDESLKPIHE